MYSPCLKYVHVIIYLHVYVLGTHFRIYPPQPCTHIHTHTLTPSHPHTLPPSQLIALGAASSGLSELIVAIGRSQDPYDLSEHIVPQLECLLKLDFSAEKGQCCTSQQRNNDSSDNNDSVILGLVLYHVNTAAELYIPVILSCKVYYS